MSKNAAASSNVSSTANLAPASHDGGGGAGGRAEAVFLTPRVLDQGAFDAMAGELKGLIQDADGQGQNLRKTTDDVKGLTGALRTALIELQNRLERAGKVSPTLEHWVVEARELTAKGIDPKRVTKELERAIEGIVESRKAEFEHSVAPTVETLRQLRREMDRMKANIEAAIEGALTGAEARVASLEARARAAVDAMNDRAAEIERAMGERFAAAEDRLAAGERRAAGVQHRTNSVLAQAEEAGRRAEVRAREIEQHLDTATSRAGVLESETIAALSEGLDVVERRATKLSELPELLSRGERMMSDARESVGQAEAFMTQMEQARRVLADDLLSGAGAIDGLVARAESLGTISTGKNQEALCTAIQAAIDGSQRVEEITRLRLAELREVENLLGSLGGRVASLRAAAMQIPEIKPKSKRESGRDAA
jgi:ABC-type transporter Mla subunit MlaD